MALFEHKPVHVRKKIALIITFSILFLLILIMVITYISPKDKKDNNNSMTKVGQFYATILENAQSYFVKK